ncbi:MAG TPA: Pr6Pr family membrane protein [Candidatus Saccharimonadales bacterium]|nr:Pr6Pr family membrane protein [Candidatus Saccharimonadales bacterium]
MDKRSLVVGARLLFGCLVIAAVFTQVGYLVGHNTFNAVNFLSFFTNLSNIFAAFVFIMSALYLVGHRQPSVRDDVIRGAAVMYMSITGVIYVTLLSGEDLGLLIPWVNTVLHAIMPIVVVLDWFYQPQRSKLTFKQTLWWLVFPLVFLVYSLIRGAVINWYPYPFLNPAHAGGYGGVALYCIGILGVFLLFSLAFRFLGNKLRRNIA